MIISECCANWFICLESPRLSQKFKLRRRKRVIMRQLQHSMVETPRIWSLQSMNTKMEIQNTLPLDKHIGDFSYFSSRSKVNLCVVIVCINVQLQAERTNNNSQHPSIIYLLLKQSNNIMSLPKYFNPSPYTPTTKVHGGIDEALSGSRISSSRVSVSTHSRSMSVKKVLKYKFKNLDLAYQVRQKLYKILIVFDSNGNIEFEEQQIKEALTQILNETPEEIKYVTKNVFRYDTNNDGIITYEEFSNFCLEQHFGEMAIQRLHKKGIYKRGRQRLMIQPEFYETLCYCLGFIDIVPNKQIVCNIFSQIDVQHKGYITYQQYFTFLKQYFGSKSQSAVHVTIHSVQQIMKDEDHHDQINDFFKKKKSQEEDKLKKQRQLENLKREQQRKVEQFKKNEWDTAQKKKIEEQRRKIDEQNARRAQQRERRNAEQRRKRQEQQRLAQQERKRRQKQIEEQNRRKRQQLAQQQERKLAQEDRRRKQQQLDENRRKQQQIEDENRRKREQLEQQNRRRKQQQEEELRKRQEQERKKRQKQLKENLFINNFPKQTAEMDKLCQRISRLVYHQLKISLLNQDKEYLLCTNQNLVNQLLQNDLNMGAQYTNKIINRYFGYGKSIFMPYQELLQAVVCFYMTELYPSSINYPLNKQNFIDSVKNGLHFIRAKPFGHILSQIFDCQCSALMQKQLDKQKYTQIMSKIFKDYKWCRKTGEQRTLSNKDQNRSQYYPIKSQTR